MFIRKTTPLFCLSIVLANLFSMVSLHAPPDIEVLSPSEFNVVLPSEEKGKLISIRISINTPLGFNTAIPEYSRAQADGDIIHFSENGLNLTKGDKIYYSAQFSDGKGGTYGQAGMYVFDGDYKQQGRLGMDNNEYNYEGNLEERKITYDSHTKFKRNRRVRQAPSHDNYSPYEPHHNHFNPHNHHHGYHGQPHGHHHPHHFAPSPHGSPHGPPYPAQGPWNDHGHDHNDNNGGGRPWKGHGGYDDEEDNCDPYGKNPKRPSDGPKGRGNKRPGDHGNDDNPYNNDNNHNNNNNNGNNGNSGSDDPYDTRRSGNGPTNEDDEDLTRNGNDNTNRGTNNRGTENPNVEVFTTRRPSSTTQRSTTTPNIDIRFRLPDDR